MQAPVELQGKIMEFFTSIPNIHDSDSRCAFVFSAGLAPQLQDQIDFDGPSAQFFQLFVSTLVSYGNLEDGRDALEAILEAAKNYVGPDKQKYCEKLIQDWRSFRLHSQKQRTVTTEIRTTKTFVPGYKYDIAVSYAPVDDQPHYGEEEGWITTLIRELKIQLTQKLGSEDAYALWSEHQMPGNVPISEMIDIICDAATLIVVLSPGYVLSEWCQTQKNEFLNVVNNRVRSGSRVFVVERDQLDAEERPSEFGDLRGYQFWLRDRQGRPLRLLTPKRDPGLYYDMLNELSYDVVQELRKLKAST